MNDETLDSPAAIKIFLGGTGNKMKCSVPKSNRYAWIAATLKRTKYFTLNKKDKSIIKEYLQSVSGYSRAQISRLIGQYRSHRWIGKKVSARHHFPNRYKAHDILLLAKTDEIHQTLSGGATKKLFERAYQIYKDDGYERLSSISIAHIYNLRKSLFYQRQRRHFTKTQRTRVNLGERRKPNPQGQPGYIRIDTVHQGDQDKQKGVYHINAVDEVTQFEIVVSVEKISENYLIPALQQLLDGFPFTIKNFHSDCGSEYINRHVVKLLNKLHITLTKSRSRHSNDNALAECKNGAIVRKYLGYVHIKQKFAPMINQFNQGYLVPYLNFHRPCYFAKTIIDAKGKEKKTYPYKNIMTPYEKLKSLEQAEQYLKPGESFTALDRQAMTLTDLDAAAAVQKARKKLFQEVIE